MPNETAEEFAARILNTCIDVVNEELEYGKAAKLIRERDAALIREAKREIREKCAQQAAVLSLYPHLAANAIRALSLDPPAEDLCSICDKPANPFTTLCEYCDPKSSINNPAEDRACEGIAPQDGEPCALPLNHSGPHSHIGPYRNRRPADQVCGTCGKYLNETFIIPCPDCHGTGRQMAQGKGESK